MNELKAQSEGRVFTEAQVTQILRDLLAASEDGPFVPNYSKMKEAIQKHGLCFDSVNNNINP
jgi:hypothetical protein